MIDVGLALGPRQHLVAVGVGLVDGRSLSARAACTSRKAPITSCGGSTRSSWTWAMLHAQPVLVEDLLQQVLGVLLDLGCGPRSRAYCRFDWPMTSRIAASAAGAHGLLALRTSKAYLNDVLDLPQHGELDVDDVLVAGQHQVLGRGRARAAAVAGPVGTVRADHGAPLVLHVDHDDVADRRRQIVVQAGLGGCRKACRR